MNILNPLKRLKNSTLELVGLLKDREMYIEGSWDGGTDELLGGLAIKGELVDTEMSRRIQELWSSIRSSLDAHCIERFKIPCSGPPVWHGTIRLDIGEDNDVKAEIRKLDHYDYTENDHELEFIDGEWKEYDDEGDYRSSDMLLYELAIQEHPICKSLAERFGTSEFTLGISWRFSKELKEHDVYAHNLDDHKLHKELQFELAKEAERLFFDAYKGIVESHEFDITVLVKNGGMAIKEVNVSELVLFESLEGERVSLFS